MRPLMREIDAFLSFNDVNGFKAEICVSGVQRQEESMLRVIEWHLSLFYQI